MVGVVTFFEGYVLLGTVVFVGAVTLFEGSVLFGGIVVPLVTLVPFFFMF